VEGTTIRINEWSVHRGSLHIGWYSARTPYPRLWIELGRSARDHWLMYT